MSSAELFNNLKCASCGTKDAELSEYKKRGSIPTCENCGKKFHKWKNLLIFLIIFTVITFVVTLIYIPIVRDKSSFVGPVREKYIQARNILLFFAILTIILFVCTLIVIVLKRKFGSKIKHYFRDRNGPIIKSETDTEWVSYREWIHKTLIERGISENTISDLIEAEIERQKTIKNKKIKSGRIMVGIGIGSIIFGLISLIYGYFVTFGLIGYTIDASMIFTVYHLPTAAMFLLIGFINFISGRKKKKFYNLV